VALSWVQPSCYLGEMVVVQEVNPLAPLKLDPLELSWASSFETFPVVFPPIRQENVFEDRWGSGISSEPFDGSFHFVYFSFGLVLPRAVQFGGGLMYVVGPE
jgi:hypothetical protein